MKKNLHSYLLLYVSTLILMSFSVFAQNLNIGKMVERSGELLEGMLNAEFYGYPFFAFLATFMLVFAIVYAVAKKVPIFKEEEHKRSRMAFALAVSLMACLGSPIVGWVWGIIAISTFIGAIGLFVVFMVVGYYLIRQTTGWAGGTMGIEATKYRTAHRKAKAEEYKEKEEVGTLRRSVAREQASLGQVEKLIDEVSATAIPHRNKLLRIREAVARLSHLEGENAKRMAENCMKEAGALLTGYSEDYRDAKAARVLLRKLPARAKIDLAEYQRLGAQAQAYITSTFSPCLGSSNDNQRTWSREGRQKAQQVLQKVAQVEKDVTELGNFETRLSAVVARMETDVDALMNALRQVSSYLRNGQYGEALQGIDEAVKLEANMNTQDLQAIKAKQTVQRLLKLEKTLLQQLSRDLEVLTASAEKIRAGPDNCYHAPP